MPTSQGLDDSPPPSPRPSPSWQDRPAVFWLKEFGPSAAAGPRPPESSDALLPLGPRQRVAAIVREFLDNAYVFGVTLASRPGIHICDRLFWVGVILAAACFSLRELPLTYQRMSQRPTSVEVRTTTKAIFNIPFPAVTVCPKLKVRKRAAIDYLKRANKMVTLNETLVMPALEFLQTFRIPYWLDRRPDPVFDSELYDLFSGIDLRHFMNSVALNCSAVFQRCHWAGVEVDCCKIFSRTVSNTGICYTFNSFTSQDKRTSCNLIPFEERPLLSATGIWYLNRPKTEECGLVRAQGAGPYSALEVFLAAADLQDMVQPDWRGRGYEVSVQAANENSDIGRGMPVSEAVNMMTTVSVTYQETAADPWLQTLPPEERGCLFEDELPEMLRPLDQNWYTQDTCITVCRHLFLRQRCNCFSFIVPKQNDQCSLEEYLCIVRNGGASLLWARVTTEDLPGTSEEERDHSRWPDCRACLPMCSTSTYKAEFNTFQSVHVPNHTAAAFLNVYYRDLHSAVKYTEVRDQDPADQFVTFCAVLNLLLGLSVLSLVQIVYYIIRVLAELWGPACRRLAQMRRRFWRPRTPAPPPPAPPLALPASTASSSWASTTTLDSALSAADPPLPFVI